MNLCQLTRSIWADQSQPSLAAVFAMGCLLAAGNEPVSATDQPVAELVHQALSSGAAGDWSEREALLEEALQSSPDQELARWHKGFLKYGRTWIHVDQLADLPIRDVLNAYEQQRENAAEDVEGNLVLANWCRQHKLDGQERAHLTRVVQLSPGQSEARRRLGQRQVAGRWVSNQDLWQATTASQQLQLAFKKWQPRLKRIQAGLEHRRLQQRTKARNELLSIRNVDAIPVIEAMFLAQPSRHGSLAIQVIGDLPQYEASIALARQAVISPQDGVRRQALQLLKRRPLDDFVPALLSGLATPIQSRMLIDFVDGRLYYRHVFQQEGWEQNNLAVADSRYAQRTMYFGMPTPASEVRRRQRLLIRQRPEELAARAVSHAVETAQMREQQRQQRNAAARNLNERIVAVLAQTTRQKELVSAEDWWSWWDDENGLAYPEKPTNTQYTFSNNLAPGVAIGTPTTVSVPHACFAAGTVVSTALGEKAIDKIEVGDLVLSQDADTGEMALKPVLATTHRAEETQLLRIEIGDDQLEATEGHPFWVSGHGWSLARKLTPKTTAFALDGLAEVHAIQQGSKGATYNLVVADFHSYFVGQSRILVHDITRRRPTNSVLPGVDREEVESAR